MQRNTSPGHREPFNWAIWLYEMNADAVFDHEHHLIVDSSLGLMEEPGDDLESDAKADPSHSH